MDTRLVYKIKNNIEKIGSELCELPGCRDGDYLKNKDKGIKIGHIFNWTQSFFVGTALWAYVRTKESAFLEWAIQFKDEYRSKVFDTPMETMHDVGFLYSPYAVMLYGLTGDEDYKKMAIKAADALAMRYEPKGGYIRAWGRMDYKTPEYVDDELSKDHFFTESKGLAIIDCMMNLPILFWASEQTGHPFYKRIAMMHADTTIKYFIRDDYSVIHAFRFSEETGEPIGESNYCGYSNGSCWARGMAWAIYGFAIAYNYTGKEKYLDTSVKVLEKFMYESGKKIPVWDFSLPTFEEKSLDTSAAAIVLCGIIELEKNKKNDKLLNYKKVLKESLAPFINYDEDTMGILSEQNGKHIYASYGDYYIVESLMKENSDLRVW